MTSFEGTLLRRVERFDVIEIAGEIAKKATKASIELKSSLSEANTILSIDLNIEDNEIVLKSHDSKKDVKMTHTIGKFKIYVIVSDINFDVALNGEHLATIESVYPVKSIRAIYIHGDFKAIAQVNHQSVYPDPFPPSSEMLQDFCFNADVPRPLKDGDKFSVSIEGSFNLSLSNHKESFITIAGKTDDSNQGTFKVSSSDSSSSLSTKWEMNVPIEVTFEIKDDFILVTVGDNDVAAKIKMNNESFCQLYKIKAKRDGNDPIEVREINFF
jgi:hypothetical protein